MKSIIITLVAVLTMTGCSGITKNSSMNTLPDTLQMGHNLLIRDTLKLVVYPTLTQEQRSDLAQHTSLDVPDNTQFIGERSVQDGISLAAYKVPTGEDPNIFKVYLVTRGKDNAVVEVLDLGDFHTSEHQGPMRFGGNRFYTTDASVTFDDKGRFTVRHVMTLTSLYLKDHTLTELWRVEWDDHYEIDSKGSFVFKGQQETHRSPADLDDPFVEEHKSRYQP